MDFAEDLTGRYPELASCLPQVRQLIERLAAAFRAGGKLLEGRQRQSNPLLLTLQGTTAPNTLNHLLAKVVITTRQAILLENSSNSLLSSDIVTERPLGTSILTTTINLLTSHDKKSSFLEPPNLRSTTALTPESHALLGYNFFNPTVPRLPKLPLLDVAFSISTLALSYRLSNQVALAILAFSSKYRKTNKANHISNQKLLKHINSIK